MDKVSVIPPFEGKCFVVVIDSVVYSFWGFVENQFFVTAFYSFN